MTDINLFPHIDNISDSLVLVAMNPETGVTGNFSVGELKQYLGVTGGGGEEPVPTAYRDVVLADEPILYLEFAEAQGNAINDSSFSGIDGVAVGDIAFNVTAPKGKGINLNGGYVLLPDNEALDLTNAFAFEFWFRVPNLDQSEKYVLSKGDERYCIIWEYVNNALEFYCAGFDFRSGSQIPITDTNWHHIIYSYDSITFKGFRDGEQIFSNARNGTLTTDNKELVIGALKHPVNGSFIGLPQCGLSHLAIYNKSIANRVAAHYTA